jgi:ABC-type glycerol-3-phosphate transport system substrate-binding protein
MKGRISMSPLFGSLTRRQLLGRAAAAAGVVAFGPALAACGSASPAASPTTQPTASSSSSAAAPTATSAAAAPTTAAAAAATPIGSATSAVPAATAASSNAPVTLIVDGMDPTTPYSKWLIGEYQKVKPNVTIKGIAESWGKGGSDMREKELVMISANQVPDTAGIVWGKEFFLTGVIRDLSTQIRTWEYFKQFSPGQLQRMSLAGKYFGFSIENNTECLYVNQDLFQKVGAKIPTTWDEWTAANAMIKAANLKASNGKPVWVVEMETNPWGTDWAGWSNGGQMMDDSFTKTLIDGDKWVQGYTFYQSFAKKGWAPTPGQAEYGTLFLNGLATQWFSGDWSTNTLESSNVASTVLSIPIPKGPAGTVVSIGGIEYVSFTRSPKVDDVLNFVEWMLTPDMQVQAFTQQHQHPTFTSVWQDPRIANSQQYKTYEAATVQELRTSTYNFLENPFYWFKAATLYVSAIDQILVKGQDPATVFKQTAAQINQGLASEYQTYQQELSKLS